VFAPWVLADEPGQGDLGRVVHQEVYVVGWPADHVAGANIATRGATAWVFVNMPDPAPA